MDFFSAEWVEAVRVAVDRGPDADARTGKLPS